MTNWNGKIDPISGSRVRVREDLIRDEYTATVYHGATGATADQYGKINVAGNYTQADSFTLRAGETAVIDFGQNFAGWPEITASGQKGTTITMRTGEMLNDANGLKSRGNDGPEGSVYHANYRTAASTGRYIMNGDGDETYHSTYTFYGFRYIEITATSDITVKQMRGLVLTSMLDDIGSIETSDPDVNQLISNIKWGGYSNILSIPTDCPQRNERSGWTADTQVFSITGLYYSDLQNFYMKWMDDMRDAARASDGAFRTIAPINETEGYEAGWSDAGVIVPYNVYKMTGDKRILEQNWDAMQKFMDVYMASTNKDGGGIRYGDWVAIENNESDVKRLCAIAYYAGDALMMAEMAEALGKTADAAKYRDVYEVEKDYFQEKYVNADGSLKHTEQTSCLMALAYDLLPNDTSKEKVKDVLLTNIASHGNKLQTGFLGTAIIMQTLTKIGAADMAYNLLLQHEFPSWLYCVDLGATTTWERWNSYTVEDGFAYKRMNSNDPANMNSFNHYAYGVVGEWMYSYMAGIMYDAEQPGFKHIILQPTPDASKRMTSADASYDSPYGRIDSAWEIDGDMLRYSFATPANTTATLYLPVKSGQTVTVNGKAASAVTLAADGIEYVKTEDGKAVFNTVAGSFNVAVEGTVSIPLESIDLNKSDTTLNKGQTETLTVIYNPADTTDDKTVVWSTSDSKVAAVDNGVVTAKNPGIATITARVGSKEADCVVTVTSPLTSISLNKTVTAIAKGQTETLTVSYNPTDTTDSKAVTWATSDSNVVTVENGVVTAKKPGIATITAKVGSKEADCVVTVTNPLTSISLSKTVTAIAKGRTETLTVSYNPTDTTDSKTVTWSTSDSNVVTVENGVVTTKNPGTATITAKVGNLEADCVITVVLPGDVNGDAKLTALDIMQMRKRMLDGTATDAELAAGDLDGNGTLTALDIMKLRKLMLELV